MATPADNLDEVGEPVLQDARALLERDSDDTLETDLSSLLDLQLHREVSESKRTNRVFLGGIAILMASGLVWYVASETNRRKVDGLIQNVKESRKDVDQVSNPASMLGTYDEVLAKLGTRSTDIDTATRSMGVEPSTVKEDGMDKEMKDMMGGQGRTVGERDRSLKNLAHAVGIDKEPAPAHKP